jgi:hypothetical protein
MAIFFHFSIFFKYVVGILSLVKNRFLIVENACEHSIFNVYYIYNYISFSVNPFGIVIL